MAAIEGVNAFGAAQITVDFQPPTR